MKKVLIAISLVALLTNCGQRKKYSYTESPEVKQFKEKLTKMEQINFPGTRDQIKAMKYNIAIAERNQLESLMLKIREEQHDKLGRSLTEAEYAEIAREVKYDSLNAVFTGIIETNKIE